MNIKFRYAEEKDIDLVIYFIKELARYEDLLDKVFITEELLKDMLFEKKIAEVVFAVLDGKEIGFALYYFNVSTFIGRTGLFIEDLFLLEKYRKNGYGKAIFTKLADIALERGCGRMQWTCLDWNKPSIDFYLSVGAVPADEWTIYNLDGEKLKDLAAEDSSN